MAVDDEGVAEATRQVAALGIAWGIPDLGERVTVAFSGRLTSSLGNCRPREGRVTIARRLADGPAELLAEVVAHEAAHAAVYVLHGDVPRPHGRQWKLLMEQAGFVPRRLVDDLPAELRSAPRRRRYVWQHRCPRCGVERTAGRPVHEWRCSRCRRWGRRGRLRITRVQVRD